MRFIHLNECAEWCRRHGASADDVFALESDPELRQIGRIVFAPSGSIGLEAAAAETCLQAVTPFDEVLLWIAEWGAWPSSEDWPRFYAARGRRGERQSLEEKPGHLFAADERADLAEFLLIVLDHGWGGHILAMHHNRIDRRIRVSHDGWIDLQADRSMDFALAAR